MHNGGKIFMKRSFLKAPRTFKGGIHPPDYKEYTEGNSIQMYMDPKMDLVFPMVQHIGAPCKPTGQKGGLLPAGAGHRRSAGICVQSHSFECVRYCEGREAHAAYQRFKGTVSHH